MTKSGKKCLLTIQAAIDETGGGRSGPSHGYRRSAAYIPLQSSQQCHRCRWNMFQDVALA
eukprot:7374923-Pyramimonas_sp.AAC.1